MHAARDENFFEWKNEVLSIIIGDTFRVAHKTEEVYSVLKLWITATKTLVPGSSIILPILTHHRNMFLPEHLALQRLGLQGTSFLAEEHIEASGQF